MKERQRKRKMEVEQATFVYKKIVVPLSMRSVYWKYFGFPADENGEILSKDYIVCSICQKQIRNNHNTTNLRIHLTSKHRDVFRELQASSALTSEMIKSERDKIKKLNTEFSSLPKATYSLETNVEGIIKVTNDPSENKQNCDSNHDSNKLIYKIDVQEENDHSYTEHNNIEEYYLQSDERDVPMDDHTLCEIITKFIIMDLHCPDIVNGSGFLLLIATLQPSAEIPTVEKIEKQLIPSLYDDTKVSVIEKISELNQQISLSIEGWSSFDKRKYITFSINYIEPNGAQINSRVLKTVHFIEDSDIHYWSHILDSICLEFDISPARVSGVVMSGCGESLNQAITDKGLNVIPCSIETLQMCATACFNDEAVKEVINKLCNNYNLLADEDEFYEDCRSVWLSTYTLLETFFQRRHSLELTYELNDEEWLVIRDVIAVLSPLKTTIITLSENKLPTISVIKPIMWQLISSHFKVKVSENKLVSKLKMKISKILTDRYSEKTLSIFLTTAAFLDSRFKLLPYAPRSEIEEAKVKVHMKMRESTKNKRIDSLPNDRKRVSGMQLLLGQVCSNEPTTHNDPEKTLSKEFTSFQNEAAVSLDQCPLEWWMMNKSKYPEVYEAVLPYLCIPVCTIGLERMMWKKDVNYQNKRSVLSSNILDKIIFVNSNY